MDKDYVKDIELFLKETEISIEVTNMTIEHEKWQIKTSKEYIKCLKERNHIQRIRIEKEKKLLDKYIEKHQVK